MAEITMLGGPTPPTMLATVDELEAATGATRPTTGAARTWLELLLAGASEAMERESERIFRPLQTAADDPGLELVHATSAYARIPDARELTAVRINGTTLAAGGAGGYRLHARRGHPAHAIMLPASYFVAGYSGVRASYELELEGRFGFDPTPADVKLTTITWAARTFYEHQARLADQTADPEGGASAYFRQVPAGVLATIKRYRVPGA